MLTLESQDGERYPNVVIHCQPFRDAKPFPQYRRHHFFGAGFSVASGNAYDGDLKFAAIVLAKSETSSGSGTWICGKSDTTELTFSTSAAAAPCSRAVARKSCASIGRPVSQRTVGPAGSTGYPFKQRSPLLNPSRITFRKLNWRVRQQY